MDEVELAAAAPEMRRLAEFLVPLLLRGTDPRLESLRIQWSGAARSISGASACGFYLDIAVPPELPRVDVPNQGGGGARIPVAGCEQPSGCVLYIVDGALSLLEVYNVIEWGSPLEFGRPTQIQSIVLDPVVGPLAPD